MGLLVIHAKAVQQRKVKLVLLSSAGALAGDNIPSIPCAQSCCAFIAEVIRQVAFAPSAILGHAAERSPGGVVQHRLVDTTKAILDAHVQRALQLAAALLAEFFRCLCVIVCHGSISLADPLEGIKARERRSQNAECGLRDQVSNDEGWRPRMASSRRIARARGRFMLRAATVARPVAVRPRM